MIDLGNKCFLRINCQLLFTAAVFLLLAAATGISQTQGDTSAANTTASSPTLRIEQCSNGSNGDQQCTGANWSSTCCTATSRWLEGSSMPYRSVFTGLTPGQQYHVTISYGTTI